MNAIILAAGKGTRLLPDTLLTPKPLIEVDGISIIERQIYCLREAGIRDIYIVVGYQYEKFEYLVKKHGVNLVYNPQYEIFSNVYSLWLSKDFFGNTWVIEGDVFIMNNFIDAEISRSTYFSGVKQLLQGDGALVFNDDFRITEMIPLEWTVDKIQNIGSCYIPSGVSFWTIESASQIINSISKSIDCKSKLAAMKSWDYAVMKELESISVYLYRIHADDWIEIDSHIDLDEAKQMFKNKSVNIYE